MSVLAHFGVAGDLPAHQEPVKYPPVVPGRVAHIDADFLAYQVSAESNAELDPLDDTPRKSLEDMKHNAREAALHLTRLSGAETYVCHITPSSSNKGGRYTQAIQREYQANRKDRANKPEHLDTIRTYIGQELNGAVHLNQEADDGLAQAAYNAKDPNKVVIVSKDKDLRMVPGLHLDQDTGRIINVDGFGFIELDKTKSTTKLVGYGTKFFWAQLLMGDPADNIQGVPHVTGSIYLRTNNNKQYLDALAMYQRECRVGAASDTTKRLKKAITAMDSKTKACGPALTYKIINPLTSDAECFKVVRDIYLETGKHGHEYRHWESGKEHSATQALLSEMQLLWMRRNENPNDVLDWVREVCSRE